MTVESISFDPDRLTALLQTLERLASGQVDLRLPVSPRHDGLDAIAHGINALVGELERAHARSREAQDAQAAELRIAVVNAQARSDALLRAIPDLMFVLGRDGTYLDYHARGVPRQNYHGDLSAAVCRDDDGRARARLCERCHRRRRVRTADGRTTLL
jgi:hypothetical protein